MKSAPYLHQKCQLSIKFRSFYAMQIVPIANAKLALNLDLFMLCKFVPIANAKLALNLM